MAHEQTGEEIAEEFRKTYPQSVAELAHHLWNAICHLNLSVSTYSQLYSSKEVIEILLKWICSVHSFPIVAVLVALDDLFPDWTLDRPCTKWGSKDGLRSNASFAGFGQVLREAGETAAADALDEDFKAMKPALDKVRAVRNRMLAHADLQTVLRKDPPLPPIPHAEIETLVDEISRTYIRTDARFRKKEIYFKGIGAFSGVDALIAVLRTRRAIIQERE